MSLLLIAFVGAVLDIIWTLMIQAITSRRAVRAAVLQGMFTVLVVGATWSIVRTESVPALMAYAVGSAIGTWFVVRYFDGPGFGNRGQPSSRVPTARPPYNRGSENK